MKKVVFLLLVLSVFSVAKTTKMRSEPSLEAKTDSVVAETSVNADSVTPPVHDESLKDSSFTLYLHPFSFVVPYSHFWAGVNVPNGVTDYPLFHLTFEWKLIEKISLVSMPHYVRVDRSDDGYKIHDIGLQESFRLYGVGGKRWRYFQAGLLLSHLRIHSDKEGAFNGWLYGFMFNGGIKKILNGGEGFLGRFAAFLDVGLGYAWISDFEADRDRAWFKMDKGLVIDVNLAIGFQI